MKLVRVFYEIANQLLAVGRAVSIEPRGEACHLELCVNIPPKNRKEFKTLVQEIAQKYGLKKDQSWYSLSVQNDSWTEEELVLYTNGYYANLTYDYYPDYQTKMHNPRRELKDLLRCAIELERRRLGLSGYCVTNYRSIIRTMTSYIMKGDELREYILQVAKDIIEDKMKFQEIRHLKWWWRRKRPVLEVHLKNGEVLQYFHTRQRKLKEGDTVDIPDLGIGKVRLVKDSEWRGQIVLAEVQKSGGKPIYAAALYMDGELYNIKKSTNVFDIHNDFLKYKK